MEQLATNQDPCRISEITGMLLRNLKTERYQSGIRNKTSKDLLKEMGITVF